ncbi:hypothetical protein IT568_05610, partial [bacterium]|nr:hypothetical protein [bacterium]
MTKYFWFLLIFISLLIACDSTDFLIDDSNFEPIDIEFEEFIADSTSFYFPDTMDGQGKGGYLFIGDFAGYKTASLIKFNPVTTLSQDTIFVDSVVFEFYADKLYYRKNAYQTLPEPTNFTFTLQEYLNDSWRESTIEWEDLNLADNNLNFLQQYEMTTKNDSIIFIGDSTYTGTDSSKVNYTTRVKKFRFKFYQILIDKIVKAS